MGFPVDMATVAKAQIDYNRGTYDPKDYVPRPALISLVESFVAATNWQPNFSWDKRPTYENGKKVEDGDLIVLAGRRGSPTNPYTIGKGAGNDVNFMEIREYNGSHYLVHQYNPDRKKANHFVVTKTADNKINLIHVETKNALEWQGDWVGVDTYYEKEPLASNVAFDKGMLFFEKCGKPGVCVQDTSDSFFANVDYRGYKVSIWPVKVALVETPLGSVG